MKPQIDVMMLKIADGGRVLRFSEPISGLCLEKRLGPQAPVAQQTDRWKHTFISLLERETGAAG